jgi:hypothetical protein
MSPERYAALIETNRALTARLAAKLSQVKARQQARETPLAIPAELETGPHSRADERPVRRRLPV